MTTGGNHEETPVSMTRAAFGARENNVERALAILTHELEFEDEHEEAQQLVWAEKVLDSHAFGEPDPGPPAVDLKDLL